MSLSDKQFEFGKDAVKLLQYIIDEGDKFTFGEVQRPEAMQLLYFYGYEIKQENSDIHLVKSRKKSKTLFSRHKDKFAIDINLFKFIGLVGISRIDLSDEEKRKYEYIPNALKHKIAFQKYGDYWESLSPKNRWGGNWAKIVNNKLVGFYDGPHFERKF